MHPCIVVLSHTCHSVKQSPGFHEVSWNCERVCVLIESIEGQLQFCTIISFLLRVRCEVKQKQFSYYSHGNCSLEDTGKSSEKKRESGGKGDTKKERKAGK